MLRTFAPLYTCAVVNKLSRITTEKALRDAHGRLTGQLEKRRFPVHIRRIEVYRKDGTEYCRFPITLRGDSICVGDSRCHKQEFIGTTKGFDTFAQFCNELVGLVGADSAKSALLEVVLTPEEV